MKSGSRSTSKGEARALVAAFACAVLGAACGSKSERAADAGRDARVHDGSADGDSAADVGGGSTGTEGAPDTGTTTQPPPEDSGAGSDCATSGCPGGQICCASVGGLIRRSTCSEGKSCAGGAEACVAGRSCAHGACQKYVCTQSGIGIKSIVYACAPPVVPGGMCSTALDLDGGPSDGGP